MGIALYGLPVAIAQGGRVAIHLGLTDIALVLALAAALLILHEAIHAIAMRCYGARPIFGATLVAVALPALYVAAPGHRFSRGQFLVIAAAPAGLISVLGLLDGISPWGALLILPLAAHLAGCSGDAAIFWQVARQARGTIVEDRKDGLVFLSSPAAGEAQGRPLSP